MHVSIIIPTLNEGNTVGDVIRGFRLLGYDDILVIDGCSIDNTEAVCRDANVRFVVQDGKGKGKAVIQAFSMVSADVVALIDADMTYLPEELPRFLAPIQEGKAEHVIGNRFSPQMEIGAVTRMNVIGNRILNKMFGMFYGQFFSDILTGYRVLTMDAIKRMNLSSPKFGIECELTAESMRNSIKTMEIPITYLKRKSGSLTKLHPVKDGLNIGMTIFKLTKLHNPLYFFGAFGFFFILLGLGFGVIVLTPFIETGLVTRIPLAILTTLLILLGFQLLLIGLLADLFIMLHKDLANKINKLEQKMNVKH